MRRPAIFPWATPTAHDSYEKKAPVSQVILRSKLKPNAIARPADIRGLGQKVFYALGGSLTRNTARHFLSMTSQRFQTVTSKWLS